MKVLVTGSAGFIGSEITIKLLDYDYIVVGVDNVNDYYDVNLKKNRLRRILSRDKYHHFFCDISDKEKLFEIFSIHKPDLVVNLAAQAGVRYSITNPDEYIRSNIIGFYNILEACRYFQVKSLIYASSSSVYGSNLSLPYKTSDVTDFPLSLYAATKKSNEIFAHSYSNIHSLETIGLRFFTVYGPWGRPDMAIFKFTKSIINGEKINVFNNGNHTRDFTYIDDIIYSIFRIIQEKKLNSYTYKNIFKNNIPWKIYNLGNSAPIKLLDVISELQINLNKKALIEYLPMQLGDVEDTYADVSVFNNDFSFSPSTSFELGIKNFIRWYMNYYHNINY